MMQEEPGLLLKDKKLSRKGFRGVSRQVLSAFRKRIRWVYPGGLSFSIFLSRGLSFSRPSSWARTVLRPPPVGDIKPLLGPPRRPKPCPVSPESHRRPGTRTPPIFPYFPIFCHAPAPFPETCSRPDSGHPFPGIAQPPPEDKKSEEELLIGSVFSAMSGHGFHGP